MACVLSENGSPETVATLALIFPTALVVTLCLLALAVALWAMLQAVRFERPAWSAPKIAIATWWLGTALYWVLLWIVAAAMLGAVGGTIWRLVAAS
jgi:hypothetical protein